MYKQTGTSHWSVSQIKVFELKRILPIETKGIGNSHLHGQSSQTGRVSCQASNFSVLHVLAQWARAQASHLPIKYMETTVRLAQGWQNLRAPCPKGRLEFLCFFFQVLT